MDVYVYLSTIATLSDWLRNVVPVYQKTKTNRDLHARFK